MGGVMEERTIRFAGLFYLKSVTRGKLICQRMCTGADFATMETLVFLSMAIQQYRDVSTDLFIKIKMEG
jgi:hypothetical protein